MFERTLSVPAADRPRAPLVARSGGLSNALGVERVMGIEPIEILAMNSVLRESRIWHAVLQHSPKNSDRRISAVGQKATSTRSMGSLHSGRPPATG